jgi:DNA polymerase elongation subunit (family B)
MVNKYNPLIFGKNQLENIVSLETVDDLLYIWQQKDADPTCTIIPNQYWFITEEMFSKKQIRLSGDQHFKWLGLFDDFQEKERLKMKIQRNNKDIYNIYNTKESSMVMQGITYFKGLQPKELSVLSFDIETDGLRHHNNSMVYLISNTFRHGDILERKLFSIEDYQDPGQMISSWCRWVRNKNPSVLLGHNIFSFDLPYLDHVAGLYSTTLRLGRDDSNIHFLPFSSQFRKDGSQSYEYTKCYVFGREIIDTFFLSMKYDIGRTFESYGLKSIIKTLGLEKQSRSLVDATKIRDYYEQRKDYPEMWNKTKQYAIEDSDDSLKLFDLMIPPTFYFTQSVSKSFQEMICSATGGQINNMMVRSYLQNGHSIAKADPSEKYEGAISFGVPGIYQNCFKVDVSSLYPSIIRQYEISAKHKDVQKHFLQMVEYFTLERLKNKKLAKETGLQYYKDLEQTQKQAANSFYGMLGSTGTNYNYPEGAAAITRYGREILNKAIEFATQRPTEYWQKLSTNEEEEDVSE